MSPVAGIAAHIVYHAGTPGLLWSFLIFYWSVVHIIVPVNAYVCILTFSVSISFTLDTIYFRFVN